VPLICLETAIAAGGGAAPGHDRHRPLRTPQRQLVQHKIRGGGYAYWSLATDTRMPAAPKPLIARCAPAWSANTVLYSRLDRPSRAPLSYTQRLYARQIGSSRCGSKVLRPRTVGCTMIRSSTAKITARRRAGTAPPRRHQTPQDRREVLE
jgi:hypothetical protein